MRILKVTVRWADSFVLGGWRTLEDYQALRPQCIETTGYLVAHAPTHLTIVQSLGHPQISDSVTIPRGCVTALDVLGSTEYPPQVQGAA